MHMNELMKNLKTMPSLKTLDLSGNKIGDEGMIHLCKGVAEHNNI